MRVIFYVFLTCLLISCSSGERNIIEFTIEKNGPVRALPFSSFEGIISSKLITEDTLSRQIEYSQLPTTADTDDQATLDALRQVTISNNFIVDNDIYNFIFEISIKSKTDIFNLPIPDRYGTDFNFGRCKSLYQGGPAKSVLVHPGTQPSKDEQGFFNYKLYVESNIMAGTLVFNKVGDFCLSHMYSRGGNYGDDSYFVASNEIIIDAQEVKTMLDGLGIVHE